MASAYITKAAKGDVRGSSTAGAGSIGTCCSKEKQPNFPLLRRRYVSVRGLGRVQWWGLKVEKALNLHV